MFKYSILPYLLTAAFLAQSLPAFAQGKGVSGPATSGSRTNTDEKTLTRADLLSIMESCMGVEELELARILTKNSSIQGRGFDNSHSYTQTGEPKSQSDVLAAVLNFDASQTTCQDAEESSVGAYLGLWSHAHLSGIDFYLDVKNYCSMSKTFNLDFYTKTAPLLLYTEAAAPGSYDEYGNVVNDKILITETSWSNRDAQGNYLPATDLKSPLQTYNGATNQPVIGIFFNQGRYVECVNLKLGKYAPTGN